ncbi:MAG: hypothetical protein ABEL97_05010 [Salinibacter sp.]
MSADDGQHDLNRGAPRCESLRRHAGQEPPPSSTIHRQPTGEEREASGVEPNMAHVSVGTEHTDDIAAHFEQASASLPAPTAA